MKIHECSRCGRVLHRVKSAWGEEYSIQACFCGGDSVEVELADDYLDSIRLTLRVMAERHIW